MTRWDRSGVILGLAIFLAASPAWGTSLWNETTDGDLSGDRLNPTSIDLTNGIHSLSATTGNGDLEYIRFDLSPGQKLTGLTLVSYSGSDGRMFIGVQEGTIFSVTPGGATASAMLGYTHFGTAEGNVGDDILPDMGAGFDAMGFTPPLEAASYTFWIQQLGSSRSTYQFDVSVVPEPSTAALGMAALALLSTMALRRRRTI